MFQRSSRPAGTERAGMHVMKGPPRGVSGADTTDCSSSAELYGYCSSCCSSTLPRSSVSSSGSASCDMRNVICGTREGGEGAEP